MPADIAIVGATGAVGREALSILAARGVKPDRLRLSASSKSAGTRVPYLDADLPVHATDDLAYEGLRLALLCADADIARRVVPLALSAGATVIDNSSAFRLDPSAPLVVPEINGDLLDATPRLIANPNCSTVILLCALEPLRREFGLEAVDVATYQAVSGAGAAAVDELLDQTRGCFDGRPAAPRVFGEPIAFNLFSHDSPVDPATGLNGEERKIIDESRRILAQPGLRLTPTCVRVPVLRAHTQAITVTLSARATERQVRSAYTRHARQVNLEILDDRDSNRFPTPLAATGRDPVLVGRFRPDPGETALTSEEPAFRRWSLLASGDQLRKGAALNAVQIAERLGLIDVTTGVEKGSLPVDRRGLVLAVPHQR